MANRPRKHDTIVEGDQITSLDFFTDTTHPDMMICLFSITRGTHQRIYIAMPDMRVVQYRGKALLQWLYDNRHKHSLTHCQEIHLPKGAP